MNIFIHQKFYKYYQNFPITLVDVGASGGLLEHWASVEDRIRVVAFEPDKRSFVGLGKNSNQKRIYINAALFNTKEMRNFYLTKKQEVSSIFKPNYSFLEQFPESERFKITEILKMETDTMDNQLEKYHIDNVDFIKLDTQGSELLILEGAVKTLENVLGVEIEVEFASMYEGQPLFADVDRFLRSIGFQLFALKPGYWKRKEGEQYGKLKGQMIYADAFYLLDPKVVNNKFGGIKNTLLLKSKILKVISIAILHGYADYALAIFEQNKHIFDTEEICLFYKEIEKTILVSLKIPNFRGRARIASLFKKLYGIFRLPVSCMREND